MTEFADICRWCHAPLHRTGTRGPIPTYCSIGCRRAIEYERRRVQRRLIALERNREWHLRVLANWAPGLGTRAHHERELDHLADRIGELERRLRTLLDERVT